jgi:hypothetical protein
MRIDPRHGVLEMKILAVAKGKPDGDGHFASDFGQVVVNVFII